MKKEIDLNKLNTAIIYAERMSLGYNPVTGKPVAANDTLNNPNVIRCMYFIKDILKDIQPSAKSKEKQSYDEVDLNDLLQKFEYKNDKCISYVLDQLYLPVSNKNVKKISATKITSKLLELGYLSTDIDNLNKKYKIPTEKGVELGIRTVEKYGKDGVYLQCIYNQQAQEYVIELIKTLV